MLNVLIVDDEALVRTGIRYSIDWAEYDMQVLAEADCVDSAINVIYSTNIIDVVFTDIVMPEKNGLELLMWIKENHPFITTVVLSYHNDFNYVQKALRLGAADYIIKTELDYPDSSYTLQGISKKARNNKRNHWEIKQPDSIIAYKYAITIVSLDKPEVEIRTQDLDAVVSHYQISQNSYLLMYLHEPDEQVLLEMEHHYSRDGILLSFRNVGDFAISNIILSTKLFISRDLFYCYLPHLNIYDLNVNMILNHECTLNGPEYVHVEEQLSSMQWIHNDMLLKQILEKIVQSRLLPSSVYNLFYCVQMQWGKVLPL